MKTIVRCAAGAADLAASRGLHYGDGVFRTLLVMNGKPVDWSSQYARLTLDAAALGLDVPVQDEVHAAVLQSLEGKSQAAVKILVAREFGARGYAPQGSACEWVVHPSMLPPYRAQYWTQGIAAVRSAVRLAEQPALAGIKHLNRLEQVLASRGWAEGVVESIMCDFSGRPICGTRSNLFWVRGATLCTPALTRCGVAGMMRAKVTALARHHGVACAEVDATWDELAGAGEIFVTNSLIGIWPVRTLERRSYPAPGPLTSQLAAALSHPWAGA